METNNIFTDNDRSAQSNKLFYDLAADIYEEADGRRGSVPEYLEKNIACQSPDLNRSFLDLGAGTGYVSKIAAKYFEKVYSMDISRKMLKKISGERIVRICHDMTKTWPFPDDMFDKIVCISTIHHIANFAPVLDEVNRCLAPGGIFYTDLDIDKNFVALWSAPLKLYRLLRNPAARYIKLNPGLNKELFDQVEIHSNGISGQILARYLERDGLLVRLSYHWGNKKSFPKGFAPYVSIWAEK